MDPIAIALNLFSGVFGVVIGALITYWGTIRLERKKEISNITQKFIGEFFSASFLQHRIAVTNMWHSAEDGRTTYASIAEGFWYPGKR
jgi:ABC-type microcin C transport system permease subunit YejE